MTPLAIEVRWVVKIGWIAAALCAGKILQAQAMRNDTFHLANGAQVFYQTYSQADVADRARMFGATSASGNSIQRTMTDGTNRTWLGFALQIVRLPGDPIRFRISMGPLDNWGFFGQSAPAREIQNGDRVLLDVLQEPGTGRKIYDTFQVGIGVDMQMMPMAKTIPQIPNAGALIHLQSPNFLSGATSFGKTGSALNGATIGVRVPGRGRFRFSSRPGPEFRMEAIAEGNHLMFVTGNAQYSIECSGPVMDSPGAWYLWVKYDPAVDSRPDAATPELALQDE
jgi:hypothetical protein